MMKSILASLGAAAVVGASAIAAPAPVDLSTWSVEGGSSNWQLAPDNNSVTQFTNGSPTFFFTDELSQGRALSGTITVNTTGDDDYIGFVLGYESGDYTTTNPGFLLVDWKQGLQSGTPPGLTLNRVVGNMSTRPPFSSTQRADTLEELARGTNLGMTGWNDLQTYDFRLVFTDSLVQIFVDDILEISVNGTFKNGGFGFYNYSQGNVTYGAIGEASAAVPVPGAAALFIPALLGGAVWKRRKAA